jgi:hypothetical protein
MARIVVQSDDQRTVLLDEKQIRPEHLNNEHSATQLLERLQWAIRDAEGRSVGALRRPSRRRSREERVAILSRRSAVGRSFD